MAEGLQFAGGGSSSSGQTGIIQQGYRPPQTPIIPAEGPIIAIGPTTAGQILEWNGTEWTEPRLTGAFIAITTGVGIEGTPTGRTEMAGHMARLKGTVAVEAGKTLPAGNNLLILPASLRPQATETIPWSTTTGTYIEIKIESSGSVSVSIELIAAVNVNLTGLEYELV